MKRNILSLSILSIILIAFTSCKDKNTEVETSEAIDVIGASAAAVTYNVDTDNSVIFWKGSKPLGTHNGTINLESGTLAVIGTSIEAGNFRIDMNTITDLDLEGDRKNNLENHLKGTVEGKEGDFFNVNKYPYATFELTEISEQDGKTLVGGNLTIKEKTHHISFPAIVNLGDDELIIKSESFTLDRTKWEVNYGSKSVFDNLGDKFIDDEMELTISLIATKS